MDTCLASFYRTLLVLDLVAPLGHCFVACVAGVLLIFGPQLDLLAWTLIYSLICHRLDFFTVEFQQISPQRQDFRIHCGTIGRPFFNAKALNRFSSPTELEIIHTKLLPKFSKVPCVQQNCLKWTTSCWMESWDEAESDTPFLCMSDNRLLIKDLRDGWFFISDTSQGDLYQMARLCLRLLRRVTVPGSEAIFYQAPTK